jgi:hypothetical protein
MLFVGCLESYLNDLQRWWSEWRIAINVSKSTAIIFAHAGLRFIQPQPTTLFEDPIQWVDTTHYLRVTLDKQQMSKKHQSFDFCIASFARRERKDVIIDMAESSHELN